ncbi:neuroendocrine convertase 1-like [Gadus macrocephalus]|uniref:neuroendocrine convertase 1-like n=1 Tax=Gadus macrocephalus TaxID=80720 RepID=UPI0028CB7E5A|nr:neuroendocrine convertase 1-like [Gadus macrocephalus]
MPIRDEENGHGTRCAGEIAMEANNSYCGVGIAFNARIGGIRLLGGPVTDAMEAVALTFSPNLIQVYVCSWGPPDNGSELGGPGRLARRALQWGAHKASSLLLWPPHWGTRTSGVYTGCTSQSRPSRQDL